MTTSKFIPMTFAVALRRRINEHKVRHLTTMMDGDVFEFIEMSELPTSFTNVFVIDTQNTMKYMMDYKPQELRTYKHPDNALYIFGEDSGNIPFHQEVIDSKLKGDVVFISLPSKGMLHQVSACAFILYDRYYKETLQYTNKPVFEMMNRDRKYDLPFQQSTSEQDSSVTN